MFQQPPLAWIIDRLQLTRGHSAQPPENFPRELSQVQCVDGQPLACHGELKNQMQPLQCAAAMVEPAPLGIAAEGLAGGLWGVWFCRSVQISGGGGSTRQPQRTEPCQCVNGQPRAYHGALQGQMQPLMCEVGMEGHAFWAAAGPGGWFSGVAFWPVCGDFQRRK